jgi:Zn-finger nucleic acid-binding protein
MPLRDEFPTCPTCRAALTPAPDERRLACGTCEGVLVTDAAVMAAVQGVLAHHDAPETLPYEPATLAEPAYQCPRCAAQMAKHSLYGIQIDRCDAHGVWFERQELQRVLEQVGLTDKSPGRPMSEKVTVGITVGAYIALGIIRFVAGL